jgi:hypothetical protein
MKLTPFQRFVTPFQRFVTPFQRFERVVFLLALVVAALDVLYWRP